MSTGSIAGIVVAAACVLFVVAGFMLWKKRAKNRRSSMSSIDKSLASFSSQAMPIAPTSLTAAAAFGTLNSDRNRHNECNMDTSLYNNKNNGNPFLSRASTVPTSEPGIWDDPVLVAARIPLDKLQLQELVSRGGFGQVFSGTYNGETVAVKTLLPDNRHDMTEITALFAETKVMAGLEHPCIVRFVGIAWDSLSSVSCVSEFMVGGDLRALLDHFEESESPRSHGFDFEKVKIALHVVHALTYLHSLQPAILHRDLKSRNVLLSSQLDAKLTDFGVSRERSDDIMTSAVGTSLWMAPEVMMGGRYDDKADVYSFGVLLSEIDTHLMPYSKVKNATGRKPTEAAILQMVALGNLQVEFSPECSSEMRELGLACIALDPYERPSAADALYKLQLALKDLEVQEVTL
ncbi:hypothetical protein BBJ28_00017888 [Nothophytophthora sp. Chile5]|nr:hypothetical protein BBJ28_00017888 [Nothophytophthora sp. Chile5]